MRREKKTVVEMFGRKKPPQLTIHEELQQTYNDCCNLTIKNISLEEDSRLEDALKGWKSLHTSLLYKLELFEKSIHKMSQEEVVILQELKDIRDQNVKHLIRVQLRMDELNRKKPQPSNYTPSALKSNMTVPSLRKGAGIRSMNNGSSASNKKKFVHTLRVTQQKPLHSKKQQQQANAAANVSWQKPKISINDEDEEDVFGDFDQDLEVDWDRVEDHKEPDLIDLHNPVSQSMENLTLKPRSRESSLNSNESPLNSLKNSPAPKLEHLHSKSTPDISKQPVSSSPPKYVYNKPRPMNINRLMKKSSGAIPTVKKEVIKTQAKKQTKVTPSKQQKSSNITYNYVPIKKKRSPSPVSPLQTMVTTKEEVLDSETDDEEVNDRDLLNVKVQNKLIKEIRGIDEDSAKQIFNDIIVHGDEVYWEDIVGLDLAKNSLKEAVVYPFLRPDLFKGLREPTRGMLLFGPPGTGKTMLARAVATESKSTFFSITSSSITSKYLGESEKLVRALFLLAKKLSPLIVFIDEIDSLLGSRSEGEIESIRRIKNEFLIQWSELSSSTTKEDNANDLKHQVLILGATNLPWSIDEAARRRFVKRQYIPLPEGMTRINQVRRLLKYQNNTLNDEDYEEIEKLTENFSGSDITALCKDSAMGPLRSLGELLLLTPTEEIRPINIEDFRNSLKFIRPSVLVESLGKYEDWARKFGSSGV